MERKAFQIELRPGRVRHTVRLRWSQRVSLSDVRDWLPALFTIEPRAERNDQRVSLQRSNS